MMLDSAAQYHLMSPVYSTLEELAKTEHSNHPAYLEAKMVYHTVCGSVAVAAEAARTFLSIERQRGTNGDLCRHLANTSRVLRTAGFLDEAYALLLESEAFAVAHKLTPALRHSLPTLVNWDMEKGDLVSATAHYEKLLETHQGNETPYEVRLVATAGARLALYQNKPRLARTRFAATLDDIVRLEIGQSRTYELALYVAIDLFEFRVSQRALNYLEASYLQSRESMTHGFATVVLCEALRRSNCEKRATVLYREYRDKLRRERYPLGPGLTELFASLPDGRRQVRTTE
jgi:hypothetical protein